MKFIILIFFLFLTVKGFFSREYNLILIKESIRIKRVGTWVRIVVKTNETLILKYTKDSANDGKNGKIKRKKKIKPGNKRVIRGVEDQEKLNHIKLKCMTICKVQLRIKKRSSLYGIRITGIILGILFGVPSIIFIYIYLRNYAYKKIYIIKFNRFKKFYYDLYNIFFIDKVKEKFIVKSIYEYANLYEYIKEEV